VEPKAGQELLQYRLVGKIGEGGMGVVWKATDTSLDRDVAIKFLPPAFSDDRQRLARFEREAKLLAQLNHPNIAQIYGLHETPGDDGRTTGGRFLVMEFVPGADLTESLEQGALPYDTAIKIAAQSAAALEAAHRSGVVHRDLKPANIRIAPDGTVKVLDLGLAKAVAPGAASGPTSLTTSPTITSAGSVAGTAAGLILGTAAYMSPEQARGNEVDARTDVWAWGCVVFEMLTGHRLFAGDTISDSIASILRNEPPWVTLPPATPYPLRKLLERCLAKDADRRMHSMADVRLELEEADSWTDVSKTGASNDPGASVTLQASTKLPGWTLATIVVLALATIGLAARSFLSSGGESTHGAKPRVRVTHETFYAGQENFPKVSPDGSFLVYAKVEGGGPPDLFLQRVGGSNPINLTHDPESADVMPAFSPDGRAIAFCSLGSDGGGIFVMGATGESRRRLTEQGFDPTWSSDGTQIVYAEEGVFNPLSRNSVSKLFVVEVATGESREFYEGDAVQPSWSPNGHRIAFWASVNTRGQRDLFTIASDGSDLVQLTDDAAVDWNPVWSPDGRHLYFASDRGGTMNLWRMPLNERTGIATDEPEPVTLPTAWAGWFSLTNDARIAYVSRDARSSLSRVPLDPGTLDVTGPPETITSGAIVIVRFAVSPDGTQVVFRNLGVQEDLYLIGSDGSGMRKLTDDPARDRGPAWSADGESILFYSTRGGDYQIWSIAPDGSNTRALTAFEGTSVWFPGVSPDGTMFSVWNGSDVYLLDLNADRPLTMADATELPPIDEEAGILFRGQGPLEWSPDGRYLAGSTSGSVSRPVLFDVERGEYVFFDENLSPGFAYAWAADGRAIVFVAGDNEVRLVDVETGASSRVAASWTASEDDVVQAVPTPDLEWLYYLSTSTESDVWLAKID
jgi:Tol biopolymer transport system component